MSEESHEFLENPANLGALNKLLRHLSTTAVPKEIQELTHHLTLMLKVMTSNPSMIDDLCRTNINWIGSQFISAAENFDPNSEKRTEATYDLFTMAYRFICELEFGLERELSFELRAVKSFVDNNISTFPEGERRQLVFANYFMPAQIVKKLLERPDIKVMREFNAQQTSAAQLKESWDTEILEKENRINDLKAILDRIETGFNFVGLVDGFRKLTVQKRREKRFSFISILFLATLAIAPILTEAYFLVSNIDSLEKHKGILWLAVPPLIGLEILLIYFFRVVLFNFRSVSAQLLQLDLRTALCQFIQSYSSYAAEIKEKNPSGLEKFEHLIFSGLITNEEKLPSTFDGTDQLVKLIQSIKST